MKLLEITTIKIIKDENCENVSHLEVTEVVLVHCNIVNNDYQYDSQALYALVPKKWTGLLLDILPTNFVFKKHSEFSYTELWFTDQNSTPLGIDDKTNIVLVIT